MMRTILLTLIFTQFIYLQPIDPATPLDLNQGVIEVPIKILRNASEYYSIAQSQDNWVVVLYEKWCGYSQTTLKMLDELRKNSEFIKTKV
jgi:hypothetical protein